MSVQIRGGATTDVAGVDTNKNLQVNPPTVPEQAGFTLAGFEVDPGAVTTSRLVREGDADPEYAQRVAVDQAGADYVFNSINQQDFTQVVATMTVAQSAGFIRLNSSSVMNNGAYAQLRSYTTFPILSTYPTYFEFIGIISSSSGVYEPNVVMEIGAGWAATNAVPTEGVFFRLTAAASWEAVLNYGGVETSTAIPVAGVPSIGERHHFLIVYQSDVVEFWIDGVVVASISAPIGTSNPTGSQWLPMFFRQYNGGVSPANAMQLWIARCSCNYGSQNSMRPWETMLAKTGLGSWQNPPPAAVGQTAQWANSAAAALATLSNTTPGYATLGGRFRFNAVAGAATDYLLFAYQSPAGSANTPGRSLIIDEVAIDSYVVGAAVATTATALEWAIGVNATAASLATADSVTARGYRRIALGHHTYIVGDAIGVSGRNGAIRAYFNTPLVVDPGCYVAIILRIPLATATASQEFDGEVRISGRFELW